jgi:NitT/TauT family transport system permease protein
VAQPLAQIAASVPATALFPVVLLALVQLGGGLGVGSIVLMLLGTQWYILFNVIAGAMAIPTELREAASVFRFTRWQRWRTLILPGIFPYLVTGLVTASGGAWNASIVAEYFHFQGRIMTTLGLGAQISSATDSGNGQLLLLSTVVMATLVVCVNRAGVASALPPGGDAIPAGRVTARRQARQSRRTVVQRAVGNGGGEPSSGTGRSGRCHPAALVD